MSRCDYCDATSVAMIQRGKPGSRSFACKQHRDRAREAVHPGDVWVDSPLPGREQQRSLMREDIERIFHSKWEHL